MPIQIALAILWRDSVESITHILPHILVPILIQRQTTGCVLDKKVQNADFVVLYLWELFCDRVCDEVTPPALRGEGELFLEPGHAGRLW